jgi:hypothetical protein
MTTHPWPPPSATDRSTPVAPLLSQPSRDYIAESARCVTDWLQAAGDDPTIPPRVYWCCIQHQTARVLRILDGEPSPWDDLGDAGASSATSGEVGR